MTTQEAKQAWITALRSMPGALDNLLFWSERKNRRVQFNRFYYVIERVG